MAAFKTTLMNCQACGRKIMVRATDAERGQITCSHAGCGAMNVLQSAFYYDQSLAEGLPAFGQLVYQNGPAPVLPLQLDENLLGTDATCQVKVDRYLHDGRCYISRRHATLTVTWDKWRGNLRYQLQDGAVDRADKTLKTSLNGTFLNGTQLRPTEQIDVADGDVITLGGIDQFRLVHQPIDPIMRDTYKVDTRLTLDQTQ
jgi:FHA domain